MKRFFYFIFLFLFVFHSQTYAQDGNFNMCDTSMTEEYSGTFYDSGGEFGPYGSDEICSFLISPPCALNITLTIDFLDLEDYDHLTIYQGSNSSGQVLYQSGSHLPQVTTVTSNTGSVFITFWSDWSVNQEGWEISWTSGTSLIAPIASFTISNPGPPLNSPINFINYSTKNPCTYLWDFGDGNTSVDAFPTYQYSEPGPYNVSLIATNHFSSDTVTHSLTVQEPPIVSAFPADTIFSNLGCAEQQTEHFTVNNSGTGNLTLEFPDVDDPWVTSSHFGNNYTISPGGSIIVSLNINAEGLDAGLYHSMIGINTNDPENSVFEYAIELDIIGDPVMELSSQEINFSPTIEGLENTGTLIINNSSCGILTLNASIASTLFSVSPDNLSIPAYSQDTIYVTFLSEVPGIYLDDLLLSTNIGNTSVPLSGETLGAPTFSVSQTDTLHSTIYCETSNTTSFTIYNNGSSDLIVGKTDSNKLSGFERKVLALKTLVSDSEKYQDLINAVNAHYTDYELIETNAQTSPELEAELANVSILLIPEQDSDAHNLFTNLSNAFINFLNTGGKILICANDKVQSTGLFISTNQKSYDVGFPFPNLDPTHLIMTGIPEYFGATAGGYTYRWHTDAAVNHLAAKLNANFPSTIVGTKPFGAGEIAYIGFRPPNPSDETSLIWANTLMYFIDQNDNVWTEIPTLSNPVNIPAGDSLEVEIYLTAEHLVSGQYYSNFQLGTNDPGNPEIQYTIHLNVVGDPVAEIDSDEISFDPVITGFESQDTLIVGNSGCDTLIVSTEILSSAFIVSPGSLSIPPYEQDTLFVKFIPDIPGEYSSELSLNTTGGDYTIPLFGQALETPKISIAPIDTLFTQIACGSSDTVSFTVYNTGANDLIIKNTGVDGTAGEGINILVHNTESISPTEFNNTLDLLNSASINYNLFVTETYYDDDVEAQLENIDIYLIPYIKPFWGSGVYKEDLVDFVTNGGKVIICSSEHLHLSGLFPFMGPSGNYNHLSVASPTHPIVSGVDASFAEPYATSLYSWQNKDGIESIITPTSPLSTTTAVGESIIGEGRAVYLAFDYSTVTQNNSKILRNTIEYLASLTSPDWAESSFFNMKDTVASGDSLVVEVYLNTETLLDGNYYLDAEFITNDPENALVNYVIHMEVLSDVNLATNVNEITYDPIIAGFTAQDTIIVFNTGCAPLLTDAVITSQGFSVSPAYLNIPAFSEDTLYVTFQPEDPGSYAVEMILESNGGNESIMLYGEALMPPTLNILPGDTLYLETSCGKIDTVSFVLSNPGIAPLELIGHFDNAPPVNILALTSYANIDGTYANTIDAINAHFTHYTLNTSNAIDAEELAADLTGIDILLIPQQITTKGTFFNTISGAITNYVEAGGFILICGNHAIAHSGSFPFPNSGFYNNTFSFYNAQPDHPIMNNVPDSIPDSAHSAIGYNWLDHDQVEKPAILPSTGDALVAVKSYGEGEAVYVGYKYDEISETNSLIIGNAVKYLVSQLDPLRIKNNSFDLPATILPGDSLELDLIFDTEHLQGGEYFSSYNILTNDPAKDSLCIVLHVNVTAEPAMVVSSNEITFSPSFVGNTLQDILIIYNTGCVDLEISGEIENTNFAISPTVLTIPAYSQDTLHIQFQPFETGQLTAELILQSNAGNISINLSGEGSPAPELVLLPNEIFIDAEACADSVLVTFNLHNTGAAPLEYQVFTDKTEPELEATLSAISSNYSQITSLIPNIFHSTLNSSFFKIETRYFLEATSDTQINKEDGSYIYFTNSSIKQNSNFGSGSKYYTAIVPELFVLGADIKDLPHFTLRSKDTSESVGQELTYTAPNGTVYKGFVSRRPFTNNATTNFLTITEDLPGIEDTYIPGYNFQKQVLSGLTNSKRLYFLHFSTIPYVTVGDDIMQEIFQQFINIIQAEHDESISISGVLLPDENTEISFYLNTELLGGGLHNLPVLIHTNDPQHPIDSVMVHLTKGLNVCANFEYEDNSGFNNSSSCGNHITFEDLSLNNPNSWTWDFGDGSTSNDANPEHVYTVTGDFTVTLESCNEIDCNTTSRIISIESASPITPADCIPANDDSESFFDFTEIEFAGIDLPIPSGGDTLVYSSYACDTPIFVDLGHTYSLNAAISETDFMFNAVKCWIDYNNDGIFTPDELVVENLDVVLQTSGSFTISEEATVGTPLRMRIMAVINGGGPCTKDLGKAIDYAIMIQPAPPITQFNIMLVDECDRSFNFTDESTILPSGWHWDFGDGNTSILQDPSHTYDDNGDYEVTLVCSNIYGSSPLQQDLETEVSGFSEINVDDSPVVNQNIDFTAPGIGVEIWNWDFGDGTTLTTTTPNTGHTYTAPGAYNVSVSTPGDLCVTELTASVMVSTIDSDALLRAESNVSIYPNPSGGRFKISFSDDVKFEKIKLYDALGREIKFAFEQISQNEIEVRVTHPTAGVYLLSIQTQNGIIIKERLVFD